MAAESLEVGDLVWAKMKSYPPWPAKIVIPPKDSKVKKSHHYVYFYGSNNHAWIPDENILPHNDELVEIYQSKKVSAIYHDAIKAIVENSKNLAKYHKQSNSFLDKFASDNETSRMYESSFELNKESSFKSKRSLFGGSVKRDRKKESLKKTPAFKRSSGKRSLSPGAISSLSPAKYMHLDEGKQMKGYKDLHTSLSLSIGYNEMHVNEDVSTHNSEAWISDSCYFERAKTPDIDLSCENSILQAKHIVPTKKKIGFLGLGALGKGIVKNLLQSGHSVTLWNRTQAKCKEFCDIGAERASTPADVVSSSDITFCCVSDQDAAKKLVFGNCSVMRGLGACGGGNRGFVQMTLIDHETSKDIAEQVHLKGGRYLEAPICGSRIQAEEGTLLVIAAGDESLYKECISCFQAMSRHHVYLSSTAGDAFKLNIIHSMLVGTVYAAVGELLALSRPIELDPNDFLKILKFGVFNRDMIIQKAQSMVNQMYETNTPLKHIQRHLSLGLKMGSNANQLLPITAVANDIYKHYTLLQYGDHDVSAVFEGIMAMSDK